MKRDVYSISLDGNKLIETICLPTEEYKSRVNSVLVGYDFYPERANDQSAYEKNEEIIKILKEDFTITKFEIIKNNEKIVIFDIPVTSIVPKNDTSIISEIEKYIEYNPRVGLFYTINDNNQITSFEWFSGAIKITPETKRVFIIEVNELFYFVYLSRGEIFYNLIGKEDLFKDGEDVLPSNIINKIFRMNTHFSNLFKVWYDFYLARMRLYEEFKANTGQIVDDQPVMIPIVLVKDDFILWLYQMFKVSETFKKLIENNTKTLVYTKLHNSYNTQYAIFNHPFNKTTICGIEKMYAENIKDGVQIDDTIEYINKRFILDQDIKD